MQRCSFAAGSIRSLVWVRLDPSDQFPNVLDGNGGIYGKEERNDVREDDRLKVRHRIVRQLLEQELIGRVARRDDQQCVTVGRALSDRISTEDIRSAGLVLNNNGLPH